MASTTRSEDATASPLEENGSQRSHVEEHCLDESFGLLTWLASNFCKGSGKQARQIVHMRVGRTCPMATDPPSSINTRFEIHHLKPVCRENHWSA